MKRLSEYLRAPWAAAAVAGGLLAGCDAPFTGAVATSPSPEARPQLSADVSAESLELAAYYERLERSLLARGLLRRDPGGPDTPYSARDLTRNFLQIALYEEYTQTSGRLVPRQNPSRLHRWEKAVSISTEFGASVSPEAEALDRAVIASLTDRIEAVTGHPVSTPASGGNFRVFVVNEDERHALAGRLRSFMPGISPVALRAVLDMPRTTYCLAFATDPQQDGTYDKAVAIIRAEHPDLLRASCLHEEITQGFGLSNDFPLARPSIFNDDEEFAFLTTHDELLLKMLYDRRLRPGMTETEATPIVETIAAELMGGSS